MGQSIKNGQKEICGRQLLKSLGDMVRLIRPY